MEDLSKEELLQKLKLLELENSSLKSKLKLEQQSHKTRSQLPSTLPLTPDEYRRYGRQMQVPELGPASQIRLKNSSVLVIGAGGLGCPALLYLTGSGIGKIGIVDDDVVDITNLHRQVLHDTTTVGLYKCESAKLKLNQLNPNVEIMTYPEPISNLNAFKIVEGYDLILDCTDNPATRYLINDVCVLLNKTIVSGSGLKTEGQLSILNFQNKGPCYRCFYPTPPPPNSVTSCSDGGVIGPCIGLVGVMMACEAMKVISHFYTEDNFNPYLTVYAGYSPLQTMRTFKMRGRSAKCKVCNQETREVTRELIETGEMDYHVWCGSVNYQVLKEDERVTVTQLKDLLSKNNDLILLDVRPKEQFEIGHIKNSRNIPYNKLTKIKDLDGVLPNYNNEEVYVICRFGRDSQLSVRALQEQFGLTKVWDVKDGVNKWASDIDSEFPVYW